MGKINWGRVVLGGVLWAVVYNVLWAVAMPRLIADFRAAFEALNRPFQVTPEWMVFFSILSLIAGIFSIWFYAAIRPRYGPGPKTAAGAGFALWLFGYVLPTVGWGRLLGFSTRLIALQCVIALVAFVAATLAGAWPYKE